MPQATTSYSDLQIPTINDDGNTYGVIINQFFEDLTGKIFTLAAQITSAQADLGDTNTVNTILYNINQLTTINTILTTSTASGGDGVTSDKLRTGTTVQLHPDPYSGSHTPTSSWPAYTGTGEALAGISVPTTESEILNFDYQAFKTALDPIVSTISARISQAQADIAAARIDICKTKKYTDAKQTGGTTVRSWQNQYFNYTNSSGGSQLTNTFSANYNYTDISYVTRSDGRGAYTLTVKYTPKSGGNFNGHGVTNAQVHSYLQSTGMLSSGVQSVYMIAYTNTTGYNVDDELTTFPGGISWASDTAHLSDYTVTWNSIGSTDSSGNGIELIVSGPSNTTQPAYDQSIVFARPKVVETTVYSTPDVSSCDTNPGGPHYISGSYS